MGLLESKKERKKSYPVAQRKMFSQFKRIATIILKKKKRVNYLVNNQHVIKEFVSSIILNLSLIVANMMITRSLQGR
jgi:hypothetical protein